MSDVRLPAALELSIRDEGDTGQRKLQHRPEDGEEAPRRASAHGRNVRGRERGVQWRVGVGRRAWGVASSGRGLR
jgi:hypothetical protein